MTRLAGQSEAFVGAGAECTGEWVVRNQSGGKGGGDYIERAVFHIGGCIYAEVAEGDAEIEVVVEMRESEDMVIGEGLRRWSNELCFQDFDFHVDELYLCVCFSFGLVIENRFIIYGGVVAVTTVLENCKWGW